MKIRLFLSLFLLYFLIAISPNTLAACAPLVATKITQTKYSSLDTLLQPHLATLKSRVVNLTNKDTSAAYASLLTEANAIVATITSTSGAIGDGAGSVIVTLPDGAVVLDTGKGSLNTYDNYKANTIGANQNNRVSVMAAHMFDCGVGLETTRRTFTTSEGTVKQINDFVARRLGNYLDSAGMVQIVRYNQTIALNCILSCG